MHSQFESKMKRRERKQSKKIVLTGKEYNGKCSWRKRRQRDVDERMNKAKEKREGGQIFGCYEYSLQTEACE